MDWAEDLKVSLMKTVKKGRRADQSSSSVVLSSGSPSSPDPDNATIDMIADDLATLDVKSFPTKFKKVGGWADDSSRSSSGGKNSRLKPNHDRFNSLSNTFSDDDIPVIPDMEDLPDEKLLEENHVAHVVVADRVETYKELNSELLKYSQFAIPDNLDVSLLMNCLQNESALNDKDISLTTDQLFQEIATYVHTNQNKEDETTSFVN